MARQTGRVQVHGGVQTVMDSRPMTVDEERHLDAEELAAAFVANDNPTGPQGKYAVRWLVARELGLPVPPIPV